MKIDKERLKECYNTKDIQYFTNKYVYSNLGNLLARPFIKLNITPNQLTALWGFFMIVFSLLFLLGNYYVNIIAGVGWVICYSLDYTDGVVARYKKIESRKGPFIDMVNHRVSYMTLMFCLGLSAWKYGRIEFFGLDFNPELYIIFGFMAGLSMILIMDFGMIYNEKVPEVEVFHGRGSVNVEGQMMKNKKLFSIISNINPLVFTNMMLILPFAAAFGILDILIIFYGIFYPLATLGRYFIYLKMISDFQRSHQE